MICLIRKENYKYAFAKAVRCERNEQKLVKKYEIPITGY